ncbi:DGQHR domain-containing protein [Psychromonas arctica]|uniref:DGQHR domain-containing protein n=1 Tax=Psychromonas arctica TaxID=168275 RepID=A0ABU9H8P2_9GAMM
MELLGWNIGTDETKCYVTVMPSKEIFKISEVSRVDSDPQEGYQRLLSKKRAEDIAQYLSDGNIIPGSIILSAQEGCEITYDSSNNKINIDTSKAGLFVIDGQHRLYGSSLCPDDILLPVCIFVGLELKQEVQYFLDINSTQKGVPKTLRIELLKFLSEPESSEAILIKLFKDLGADIDSPLYNRTSATTSVPGKVSHVPFHSALGSLIEGKTLRKFDYEKKKVLIKNYLSAISEVLTQMETNDKRLTSSAFFQAIFKVFEDVCSSALTYYRNYKQSSFQNILEGIQKIDFEKHSGSNQQTINQMAIELQTLLDIHSMTLDEPNDLLG